MASEILLDVVIKATVVFAAGWAATALMYKASAASRHAVWAAVCVAALALPLLYPIVPSVPASWWPQLSTRTAGTPGGTSEALLSAHAASDGEVDSVGVAGTPGAAWSWAPVALVIWSVGFGVALWRLLSGGRAARRLTSSARPEDDARILSRADLIAGWLGAPAFAVRRGAPDWMPATWGVRRPVVMLPATAGEWPDARLDPVLVHELAHVARRDAVWHHVVLIMVAVWWLRRGSIGWLRSTPRLRSRHACRVW